MKPNVSFEADARAQGHVPERTCVGCREKGARSSLVRVVVTGDRVAVDPTTSAPGRGAWLHPNGRCLSQAVKRKAIGRALRAPEAGVEALADYPAFRES